MFMIMYMSPATEIELIKSTLVFLFEKAYSSDACGIQSNPTYAHGAKAVMVKIEAKVVFSGAKYGWRLLQSTPPARITAPITRMQPTKPSATAVWNQPAASTPRMFTIPIMIIAKMSTISSPPYTVHPAMS